MAPCFAAFFLLWHYLSLITSDSACSFGVLRGRCFARIASPERNRSNLLCLNVTSRARYSHLGMLRIKRYTMYAASHHTSYQKVFVGFDDCLTWLLNPHDKSRVSSVSSFANCSVKTEYCQLQMMAQRLTQPVWRAVRRRRGGKEIV